MRTIRSIKWIGFVAICLGIFMVGCNGESQEDTITSDPKELAPDTSLRNIVNVGGELFSIPSPIQTALLVKEAGAAYNADLLNGPSNSSNYSTKIKKALNLGVYGADLGYVTIYDNTQDALTYLGSVQQLSDELGVSGAFNKDIIQRFSNNMGNKDSMLVLVSDAYRAGDAYLKTNERHDVAGLILTGGWVEALYFCTKIISESKNQAIIERVGEQKSSLNNLINLLSQNKNQEELKDIIKDLSDLAAIFEGVKFNYTFVQPITDASTRTTHIKSETEVIITDEQLSAISEKINSIRNQIVG